MKGKNKKVILLIAVIIVVIIVVIAIAIKGNNKNEPSNSVENETAQQQQEGNTPDQQPEKVPEEFVQNMDDGTKVNTSTKLKETKTVSSFEISNISLSTVNGQTFLTADVKNTSKNDKPATGIDITLYDKDGNELVKMAGVINELKSGATTRLESGTTLDFANAYDFKVTIQ